MTSKSWDLSRGSYTTRVIYVPLYPSCCTPVGVSVRETACAYKGTIADQQSVVLAYPWHAHSLPLLKNGIKCDIKHQCLPRFLHTHQRTLLMEKTCTTFGSGLL